MQNKEKAIRPETVRRLTRAAALAALSAVLYFIPGIPVFPPIYKLDFSSVPVMLAALLLGPVDALCVLLFKDLTGLLHSSSMGVGELADFLTSAALVLCAWGVCRLLPGKTDAQGKVTHFGRKLGTWQLILAFVLSVIAMALAGALVNYYIMIPFYVSVMHLPEAAIVSMMAKIVPRIDSLGSLIAWATVPFNLLKGAVLCVLSYPLFRALDRMLGGRAA